MPIIDSQVHAYEANTPKRPWHSVPNWPPHVTGDEMVAAMDKVGVDGAIFISAFSLYQYDASYAVEVQRKHPGRFAIIKPVNPADPAVGDVIAEWRLGVERSVRGFPRLDAAFEIARGDAMAAQRSRDVLAHLVAACAVHDHGGGARKRARPFADRVGIAAQRAGDRLARFAEGGAAAHVDHESGER
jgi:predicted TIM-barrel fold metal-dependent hydrolase